jgi:hypothetical protein
MNQLFDKRFFFLMNPLNPPVLGDLFIAGGHPQTLGRKNPAPHFQYSETGGIILKQGVKEG